MAPGGPIPLATSHAALGAVFVERDGRASIASYGRPARGVRAAREAAGLVDLHDRGVLEATGPQRQKFLQGMLSNEVASLTARPGLRGRVPEREGRPARARAGARRARGRGARDRCRSRGLPPAQPRALPGRGARCASRRARTAVLAVIGPGALDLLAAVGSPAPAAAPESHVTATVAGQAVRVARAGDLPGGGLVVHAPADGAAAVLRAPARRGRTAGGPRRARRAARRGAAPLVRERRRRVQPAARDGAARRVPLAGEGLLRRAGGRGPSGRPGRQRQQGAARPAPRAAVRRGAPRSRPRTARSGA